MKKLSLKSSQLEVCQFVKENVKNRKKIQVFKPEKVQILKFLNLKIYNRKVSNF